MTGTTSKIIHSGRAPDSNESFDHLQALDQLLAFASDVASDKSLRSLIFFRAEIDGLEQQLDRFRADHGGESIIAIFFLRLGIFVFVRSCFILSGVRPGSVTCNFQNKGRAPIP